MIVSIHQPNFLPWYGYFVKIVRSDVFVILDNVQFTKGGYCNRVKIKNKNGTESWLTIPVKLSEGSFKDLNEVQIDNTKPWQKDIINKLSDYYRKAPYLKESLETIIGVINAKHYPSLASLNTALIIKILDLLRIKREIRVASNMELNGLHNNELLIAIIKEVSADTYLSGTGAKNYMNEQLYVNAGIKLEYNQVKVSEYSQINGTTFIPNLSIIDILFNEGLEGTKEFLQLVMDERTY
jgi:hypothetical protein